MNGEQGEGNLNRLEDLKSKKESLLNQIQLEAGTGHHGKEQSELEDELRNVEEEIAELEAGEDK